MGVVQLIDLNTVILILLALVASRLIERLLKKFVVGTTWALEFGLYLLLVPIALGFKYDEISSRWVQLFNAAGLAMIVFSFWLAKRRRLRAEGKTMGAAGLDRQQAFIDNS